MGTRVAALKVPGATLHYEVVGDGPVLLIIPGMPADAGLYSVLARRLAGSFTVVTYDPRGMSRSRLDGPPGGQRVEVHADDARRVLDAVGAGPARGEPQGPDPDPETVAAMARMEGNLGLWLAHVVRPTFLGYAPDIPRLRAAQAGIVVLVGDASAPHQVAYQATHALAEQLGVTPLVVPGDHEAVTRRPGELAELLGRVLQPAGGGP
jgi:hypothetical protein